MHQHNQVYVALLESNKLVHLELLREGPICSLLKVRRIPSRSICEESLNGSKGTDVACLLERCQVLEGDEKFSTSAKAEICVGEGS